MRLRALEKQVIEAQNATGSESVRMLGESVRNMDHKVARDH